MNKKDQAKIKSIEEGKIAIFKDKKVRRIIYSVPISCHPREGGDPYKTLKRQ